MQKILMILSIIGLCQPVQTAQNPLEQAFRAKYKHLDIPRFEYSDNFSHSHEYVYSDGAERILFDVLTYPIDCCFDWAEGKGYSWDNFVKNSPKVDEPKVIVKEDFNDFIVLHELGHHDLSQKGLSSINRQKIEVMAGMVFIGLCGKHKSKPYKNAFTRFISKTTAGSLAYCLSNWGLERYNEYYADSYACKHIQDKAQLEQVIEKQKRQADGRHKYFLMMKEYFSQQEITVSNKFIKMILSSPFIYDCYNFYNDPFHPSPSSRLKKFERVLQERFSDT